MTYALSGGAQSGAPISQLHWLTGAPDGAPPKFAYKNVRYAINGVPYLQDHRRQCMYVWSDYSPSGSIVHALK